MRFLHTMLRVIDLQKSVDFYTKVLKMNVIKQKDYPDGKFTLVFLGYDKEENSTLIELTYNWDVKKYELGNAFGHIAIEVEDIYKVCDEVQNSLGKVVRSPSPMKFGGTRNIAFIEDPDGYKIELIENHIK